MTPSLEKLVGGFGPDARRSGGVAINLCDFSSGTSQLWEDAEGIVHTVAQGEGERARGPPHAPALLFRPAGPAGCGQVWTTCFSWSSQTRSEMCIRLWSKSCTDILGSESTRARLKCGIQQELDQKRVTRLRGLPGHLTPTHECGKGQAGLLTSEQGMRVLGTLLGHTDFVSAHSPDSKIGSAHEAASRIERQCREGLLPRLTE